MQNSHEKSGLSISIAGSAHRANCWCSHQGLQLFKWAVANIGESSIVGSQLCPNAETTPDAQCLKWVLANIGKQKGVGLILFIQVLPPNGKSKLVGLQFFERVLPKLAKPKHVSCTFLEVGGDIRCFKSVAQKWETKWLVSSCSKFGEPKMVQITGVYKSTRLFGLLAEAFVPPCARRIWMG